MYKNDYPDDYNEKAEQELTAKQIFMQYVLPNKLLWYIAIANVFVYLLRYGILDWSPTYLKEVKHFALDKSSWAYFLYEYAGIPVPFAPYGQPQLSLAPVLLGNMDTIDVVRGGGAVRYGPQSVGGVVNFVTRIVRTDKDKLPLVIGGNMRRATRQRRLCSKGQRAIIRCNTIRQNTKLRTDTNVDTNARHKTLFAERGN